MWELDYKESWAPKKWRFWTVVLEKTLGSSLDCKEINPFNPKGNQSWIFIGSTDAEAETPILCPPDVKNWLLGKDPGRPWCWERLKAGGERDDRGKDGWMASWTRWTWVWANSGSCWWTRKLGILVHGVAKSQTQLSNWTELTAYFYLFIKMTFLLFCITPKGIIQCCSGFPLDVKGKHSQCLEPLMSCKWETKISLHCLQQEST